MKQRPLSADESQRIAADPEKSVFVTANAGSGKTKVLVDRIARLLLAGSKPSAFLCITYTKAAAAEMQRRLFERLGGWCVADDVALAADLAKLGAPGADLARARALFAQALETPGGLRIQTIHAFCERLLARFPLEAGVPPGFDIIDEASGASLLREARAAAALSPDAPKRAFERFAARLDGQALERLLDRLAVRRADFHRYAAAHQGAANAEAAIRARHRARKNEEEIREEFLAAQDWSALREAAAALAASSKKDQDAAERLRAIFLLRDKNAPARAVLEACFDFAFTSNGERYKRLATAALAKAKPWVENTLNDFADACIEARGKLNAAGRAEDAVAALALALTLDKAYAEAKARSGALDFDDLIEHAQALLERSDAAPWVLYKLDGGVDHILIDEGQDTSPLQWDVIAPLQEEFFSGVGAREKLRTVFAVGDPKQSIYGFQGADPDRFLAEAQTLEQRARRAERGFVAPTLETSFRSAPEILNAVDETLKGKPLIRVSPGAHDELRHLAWREEAKGAVEVWPLTPRPEPAQSEPWDAPMDVERGASVHALLAGKIAERVCAMIEAREAVWDKDGPRPMRAGDVIALVRTRGALFRELIKAFKRARLPVAGADSMVLRDELAVEDCLALMRVALDPADDLALACVLKGPWCDLDDDDQHLFPLAYGRGKGETLFKRLLASTDETYAAARAFVGELAGRAGADAFSFLSWALETRHGGGPTGWARVLRRLGAEARDPLEELLQRALKPSQMGAPTLQRFLYEIEVDAGQVKRELEAGGEAIRVMTVHGAKGLEAPVVILPDCTAPANGRADDGLIFDDAAGPFVCLRESDDDDATSEARATHKARMLSEHWRLLYVAMTRARDRLIVCGAQRGKGEESEESWRRAVEQGLTRLGAAKCETPFGEGLRYGAPVIAPPLGEQMALPLAPPAWLHQPAPGAARIELAAPSRIAHVDASLFSPRGDGQKRFRRGRLIHGLLERLPDVASARRAEAAQAWLERQGVKGEEARAFAGEAIAVIEDARFAAAFGPMSRAEAPIVGEVGGKAVRGVVDRLAVEANRVLVLDFKTDRPAPTDAAEAPEPYVLQLALYRQVLRAIFPEKAVSCALLWTEAPHLMALSDARLDAALQHFLRG